MDDRDAILEEGEFEGRELERLFFPKLSRAKVNGMIRSYMYEVYLQTDRVDKVETEKGSAKEVQ